MAHLAGPAAPPSAQPLPFPGTGFVVGRGEDPFLGSGWHEREVRGTDGTPYRGVDEWAYFRLRLPRSPAPGAPLHLKLLLTASVSLLDEPYQGELYVGEELAGTLAIDTENWVIRRIALGEPLPLDAGGALRLALRSRTLWVPAEKIRGNPDRRRIGCYVGAALLESAETPTTVKLPQG